MPTQRTPDTVILSPPLAKDLPGCIGRERPLTALRPGICVYVMKAWKTQFITRVPRYGVKVRHIAEDPSPKGRAQDDSVMRLESHYSETLHLNRIPANLREKPPPLLKLLNCFFIMAYCFSN